MFRSRGLSTQTMVTQLSEVVGPNRAMAPMIVPPDGGWGWVIVLVGLVGSCCVDGCVYSFFLFREPISKDLKIPQSDISYLSSLNTGFYFVGAVLACSFGNHFGFRLTMVLGGAVTSLGYASGYLLQEMFHYYVMVGAFAGFGSGFISVGGALPASFYFDKKRSIALGIVACGSGLGGVIMPQLFDIFMSQFGWRATFLFEGVIVAMTVVLGVLIRPLKPVMVVIEVEPSQANVRAREDSTLDLSVFRIPPPTPGDGFSSVSTGVGRSVVETALAQPTIAQMADDLTVISIKVGDPSSPSVVSRLHEMSQSRRVSQVLQPSASSVFNSVRISSDPFPQTQLPWYKCGCCRSKYARLPERPLMRHDLYYTGSLMRLSEYTGKDRDLDYHMNVTRVPTYYQTVQDLTKNYTIWCCHNIFTGLRYLVDYKMFKSPAFICLALCGFGVYLAFYSPFIFCKVHLDELGVGEYASMLVSLIGLGSMIGRLLSGLIITAFPRFDACSVMSAMMMLSGVSIAIMVVYDNLYFKGICLFIFGFTSGFYLPLRSLVIVDYFGLQKLTSATGVVIVVIGFASFLGPPVAESLMRYTGNKDTPFYLCGIFFALASVSLWPMKWLSEWEKTRKNLVAE
ncbi:monocarboxylate transporter 14-like isoform X2 [Macrosteles quadrilineatus]|uniref:monocarboxylate transporter 14-like isoform X2 n=1 Tax=Macrosteles quadrilineatus TaxID=74068 RepID=UPI0023E20FD6|nr:monocarboxylate transporter 14-like isoform X2 [Macrosteles quadrilineatus]